MKGFCYLGEPEGASEKRHLKVILTEPNSNGLVVVVSVTTLRDPAIQDTSCILTAGDHPFIKHDSFVLYEDATAMRQLDILRKLHSGEFASKPDMPSAVFERVLQAAKASRKMRPRIKAIQRADKLRLEAC